VAALVALTAVLVILGATDLSSALTEDVEVILTAPVRTYRVGDSLSLTVYVYHRGVLVDPSNVNVGVDEYPNAPRLLNVTRVSVGTFTSQAQILVSDLGTYPVNAAGDLPFDLFANATVANVTDEEYLTVNVIRPAPLPFEVSVIASPSEVVAGGVVNVSVTVRRNGSLQDADAVWVNVSSSVKPYQSTSLVVQHVGLGSYRAAYRVPTDIHDIESLWVLAEATLGTNTTFNSTTVIVKLTPVFNVWYSLDFANRTRYDIRLHVANETGWPVAGADVNLTYELTCYPNCSIEGSANGTTDALGAVSLTLLHTNLPIDPSDLALPFRATVTKDEQRQDVAGFAFAPSVEADAASGIYLDGSSQTYAPGEEVFVNFTVTLWAAPGTPAQFYAYTADRVLAAGETYVDPAMHIGFDFIMPAEVVYLRVSANLSGYWIYGRGAIFPTNTSAIHVGPIAIGGTTPITVSLPGRSGIAASIALLPYNTSEPFLLSGSSWYPLGGAGLYWDGASSSGSTLTYNLTLPRFLPKDQTYILVVQTGGLYFGSYGWPDPATNPVYTRVVYIANQLPAARGVLSVNDLVPGETAAIDLSRSSDPDGLITAYEVDWGDGTPTHWTADPTADHAYRSAGLYVVTVRVTDDSGATNSTAYAVRVESTVLGVRSSVFWPVMGMLGVALLAVAIILVQRRRRKPEASVPPSDVPPPGGPR